MVYTTDVICAEKITVHADDYELYKMTLNYVDQPGFDRVVVFESEEKIGLSDEIQSLPTERPILYLADDPQQILFLDTKYGDFYSHNNRLSN